MKRLAKILFLPCAMMIATVAFGQGTNNGTGGMPQTQSPTNTNTSPTPAPQTETSPANNSQPNMGQTQQSNMSGQYPNGALQATNPEQTRVQDSINRAERKAAKMEKKEARKAKKDAKKSKKGMEPADSTSTPPNLQ